jgi:putative flippase GtrA
LFRFSLVGIANTLFGALVMFGLYNLAGCGYWVSSVANYALGSVLSFFLNKYFTFGVRRWSAGMIAAFVLTIGVSYGAAYGAARPLMRRLLADSPQRFRENGALFTGMCLFTTLNYVGQRFFIFKENQSKENVL